MKKALLSLGLLAAVAGTTISFQSCDKIKDEIKKQLDPISFLQPNFTITIPPVAMDSVHAHETVAMNLQQMIDDNKPDGLGFDISLDDFSALRLKKVTITPAAGSNGFDANNNFTNFEGLFFAANTDKGIANGLLPQGIWANISNDVSREMEPIVLDWTQGGTVTPANLKDYFNKDGNTNIDYYIDGLMRQSTTQEMKVNVSIEYVLEP